MVDSRRVAGMNGSSGDTTVNNFIGVQRQVYCSETFECSALGCMEVCRDGTKRPRAADRMAHVHVQKADGSFDLSTYILVPVCATHNGLTTHYCDKKAGASGFVTNPGVKGLAPIRHFRKA